MKNIVKREHIRFSRREIVVGRPGLPGCVVAMAGSAFSVLWARLDRGALGYV